jgi:hypothetical protein
MMGNNATILYQNSSNELMQAKRYQSQISQKEFEIRLMDINNRFAPNNGVDNFYIANLQKQNIKSEIDNLIYNRNRHLCNAIDNALDLAINESQDSVFYSMAYLAISSINSFIRIQNELNLNLPFNVVFKLSQADLQTTNVLVKTEISALKRLCNII